MKRTLTVLAMVLALAMTAMASADTTTLDGAEITSPTADEVIYENLLSLAAVDPSVADSDMDLDWAIVTDDGIGLECTGEIHFNRNNSDYNYEGGAFGAELDISNLSAGEYCFVFNTLNRNAPDGVRLVQWFYIADDYLEAGGVVDASDLGFQKRGNGTHAFEGWAADAGSAGILGEFTLNYRAGEECTYAPGELDITTSVTNPEGDLVRAVLTDWESTGPGCERNDIRLLESDANEFFPRGGIFTPIELDTGPSSPQNNATDYWVPLTHGNVHIYSR